MLTAPRLDIQLMSKFTDHSCTVWRVSWNLTGTILSSSGDDGYVRMWKSEFDLDRLSFPASTAIAHFHVLFYLFIYFHRYSVNYLKQWKCAAVLKPDGTQSTHDQSMNAAIATPSTTLATTKYYKRGNLSHPNEVLLH